MKRVTIETLFGTRSWTAVEGKSLELLEAKLATLRLFETQVKDGDSAALSDAAAASGLLIICGEKLAEEAREADEAAVL